MHKHYKTVAAIAASSLLAAFAAQANKGADYQKPHHKHENFKRFTLTGGATYLEQSQDALDYVAFVTPSATGDTVNTHNLDSEFAWGYFLGFGYKISKKYDLQATWQQYNLDTSQNSSATGAVGGVTSYITSNNEDNSITAGDTVTAHAHQKLDTQVFDATLGQYNKLGSNLHSRLFAGVRYAQVNSKTTNTYEDTSFTPFIFDQYNSKFNGVGPEAGMDMEYRVYRGLGVVGSLAGAFLIGNQESNSDVYSSSNGDENSVNSDDNTRMIPTLNAKLGLNWATGYNIKDWGFSVEGGYQVAYYFNVVDQIQYQPGTVAGVRHNYSDVGIMGPYLNVSAMF